MGPLYRVIKFDTTGLFVIRISFIGHVCVHIEDIWLLLLVREPANN